MSFKDTFEKEKRELQSVKRPYETVAFLVFGLLFIQNIFFLIVQIIDYFQNKWWGLANITIRMNNSGFVGRIVTVFNKPLLQMIVTILMLAVYWFLIYYFVWNYCKKNNLAKWTWTLFVVYGPSIFLATPLIFFVIYVFRPYFARFAKRFVAEFKAFDPDQQFEEDKAEEFNENDYDKYIKDEPYSEEPEEVKEDEKEKIE